MRHTKPLSLNEKVDDSGLRLLFVISLLMNIMLIGLLMVVTKNCTKLVNECEIDKEIITNRMTGNTNEDESLDFVGPTQEEEQEVIPEPTVDNTKIDTNTNTNTNTNTTTNNTNNSSNSVTPFPSQGTATNSCAVALKQSLQNQINNARANITRYTNEYNECMANGVRMDGVTPVTEAYCKSVSSYGEVQGLLNYIAQVKQNNPTCGLN